MSEWNSVCQERCRSTLSGRCPVVTVTNMIGMTPCNLLMAYTGSLISDVATLDAAELPSVWKHVALWGGLAVTLAAGVLTGWASKRALHRVGQQRGEV